MNIGQKIYVKSINKNGRESLNYSYAGSMSEYVGMEAYDGNETTYFVTTGNNYIYVDFNMFGKKLYINLTPADSDYFPWLKAIDKSGDSINNVRILGGGYKYTIPDKTYKLNYIPYNP